MWKGNRVTVLLVMARSKYSSIDMIEATLGT